MGLPLLTEDAACCDSPAAEVLDIDEAGRLAHAFKALADPARLRLLSLIAAQQDGEACICNLTEPVGLSQGTVSHHMKILAGAGLVSRDQRGKWAYYRVQRSALDAVGAALANV